MAKYGSYTQNGAYDAADLRFSQAVNLARDTFGKVAPGVIYGSSTDGRIRVSGTSLNLIVDPFHVVVPDSARGAYVGGFDIATTIGPVQPEASNNRIDLVCWRPLEGLSVDSSGTSTMSSVTLAGSSTPISKQTVNGEVYFVKGTPSASTTPTVPAVPAGSVRLGQVYVAGGATSFTAANIDNTTKQWTSTLGGAIPSTSAMSGQASTLPAGTQVCNTSTGVNYVVTGGVLVPVMTEGAWAQFTPTLLTSGGSPSVGSGGVLIGRYLKTGKELHVQIHMISSPATNWGLGAVMFGALPLPHQGGFRNIGTCVTFSNGAEWQGFSSIDSNSNVVKLYFPFSDTSNGMYPLQNSDGSGAAGTGIPRKAGSYTLGPYHTVSVDITYEIG